MPPKLKEKDKNNIIFKDAKVPIAENSQATVANIICQQITISRESNQKYYNEAKKAENQYSQVTASMAAGKVPMFPWKGAADPFIPLTEWVVDAVHSRTVSALFSQEPFMTAVAVEANDVDNSESVTEFVDMMFREKIKIQKNMDFYIKQMLKLPFATIKYDWEQLSDTTIQKEKAILVTNGRKKEYIIPTEPDAVSKMAELILNGYNPEEGELVDVWTKSEQVLLDQPVLKYVKFDDFVWAPNSKKGTRLFWEGDRIWLTIGDISIMEQSGKFRKGITKKLKSQRQSTEEDMEKTEQILAERSHLYECYHWYGKLPFNAQNQVDFDSDEVVDQEVHAVISLNEKEILMLNFWEHRRLPFPDRVYIRNGFEETEGFDYRSMCKKLRKIQEEVNVLEKTIQDNAMLAMQKIFVKKSIGGGDVKWEQPQIFPGVQWNVDTQSEITTLNVGDVKNIGHELINEKLNYAERVSNISVFSTGANRQGGGTKTASEVSATIQEGNIGIDKFIQRVHENLRTICQWTVDYYFDRMPEGLERRIKGIDGKTIFPTNDTMEYFNKQGVAPEWSRDALAGQFDFIWKGTRTSANVELQIAIANDLQDRFLPQPMIQNNLMATWEILKKGLIARGVKDWQKILPPREAIVSEMQIADVKQQGEQLMGELPSVEERAREIMESQGVSPSDVGAQL